MRRPALAAAVFVAASCGGHAPTSPEPAAGSEVRGVVLPSGPYTLALSLSTTGLPVCQNGICTSVSLCVDNPVAMKASFNADVERFGDVATARVGGGAEALVLTIQVAATSVTGSISGSARDAAGLTVAVSGTLTGAAPADRAIAVSGNIDGQMSLAGGSCSNNGHGWSLTPR